MASNTLELTRCSFANEAREHPFLHAKSLDKALGYKIPKIEVKLLQKYRAYDRYDDSTNRKQRFQGTQTWIGLHPQVLQTPYCDIYRALLMLKKFPIKNVVDIGAGYGRVGLVLSVLYPESKFTGFEIIKQRQSEGNRIYKKLGLSNANIELVNVLDHQFKLPDADAYFIYDFSSRDDVFEILHQLQAKTDHKQFYIIARGDRVDWLMKNQFNNTWKNCHELGSSDLKIYI